MEVNVTQRNSEGTSRTTRLHFDAPPTQVTWRQLQAEIAKELKIKATRQRVTTTDKKTVLGESDDKITLADHGLGTESVDVLLKDLGPQMSWTLVVSSSFNTYPEPADVDGADCSISLNTSALLFLTSLCSLVTDSYCGTQAGPLFIHPLIYYYSPKVYNNTYDYSLVQKLALGLVLFHFLKRELETIFVHRFSRATMPLFNLLKNCGHYWGLSGIALAVPLYSPQHSVQEISPKSLQNNIYYVGACVLIFLYAEFANLATHLHLASLRSKGSKKRHLPNGFGFKTCTYANYSFELLAWTAFTALTLEWAAAGFLLISFLQIALWAQKKHGAYIKEFGKDKVKGRKALIPFLF